ncbi:MAG: nitrogen regulation protein NR(II) [Acidobacteriota bacterium]
MSTQSSTTGMDRSLILLMVLRVVVVTTLLGAAVTAEVIARPEGPVHPLYFLIALTYLLTLFYALLWPFTAGHRRLLAYTQISADLGVVTGIVYFTGGVESDFIFLYSISIISASIILYRRGGLATATAAFFLFGGLVEALYLQWLPSYPQLQEPGLSAPAQLIYYTIFLHGFGFYTVALLTSYLSENLRKTGKELEEASDHLADLQAFNQAVIDSITSGLMTTDLQGRIHFFNSSAEQILAVSSKEAVGRKVAELLGETDDFMDRLHSMLEGRRHCRMEGAYLDGRGREIYLGMGASYLYFEGQSKSGFLFSFQDLTEIKRLERQVRLNENLATMGEMAAGVAHEIRNPLASISGSVQVLQEELGLSSEQSRLMGIIVRESERLSGILSEFLAYARPPKFEPSHLDLRKVVEETAVLLKNSSEVLPSHRIDVKLPDSPVSLFADANQMKQIAWNLARNGLQAMPDGGRLQMELSRNGSGEVVMAFRDEGVGIRDGEVHEVFQPFRGEFKRGSGLGLAIVYRIVKDYSGMILVDSLNPRGTEVSVRFPLDRRTFP